VTNLASADCDQCKRLSSLCNRFGLGDSSYAEAVLFLGRPSHRSILPVLSCRQSGEFCGRIAVATGVCMTKELFVSSTPHETKVGMVEDDQLAEIYLERENEYTLAGSIYKGRVTRVLPGMQSAFVDIGLERDAFLYVSDFMELENQDEDLDELPAPPTVQEFQPAQPVPAAALESRTENDAHLSAASQPPSTQPPAREERDRGGYRGRRRRGGHRERESRVSRPAQSESR